MEFNIILLLLLVMENIIYLFKNFSNHSYRYLKPIGTKKAGKLNDIGRLIMHIFEINQTNTM